MTDPDGSKALFSLAKVEDKQLRLVNDFWHLLTKEPGNEVVLTEALAWMDARVAVTPPVTRPVYAVTNLVTHATAAAARQAAAALAAAAALSSVQAPAALATAMSVEVAVAC
jgi:hypothetical protein